MHSINKVRNFIYISALLSMPSLYASASTTLMRGSLNIRAFSLPALHSTFSKFATAQEKAKKYPNLSYSRNLHVDLKTLSPSLRSFSIPTTRLYSSNIDSSVTDGDVKGRAILNKEVKEMLELLGQSRLCERDDPGKELLEYLDYLMERKAPPYQFVEYLVNLSIEKMRKLPNVVEVDFHPDGGDVFVCGDTHGQYSDFCHIFKQDVADGNPSGKKRFIFNGDMVDRGNKAIEILVTLLTHKIVDDSSVTILRGNHETRYMSCRFGFIKELGFKYDYRGESELWEKFQELFDSLPVAAVVAKTEAFVVHGGIGPSTYNLTVPQLNALNRFIEPGDKDETFLAEFLWSDPAEQLKEEFKYNTKRGMGSLFSEVATRKFLATNNVSLLIRSHEMCDGVQTLHGGACVTVFSAANYCGQNKNRGGVIRFTKEPTGEIKREDITFASPLSLNS